ncbi:MAG: tRNA (adenine(22)-N(1))-methyltransferase [Candidatus Alkaliphilus sp. MAG34]|nr:SAM-dependent methyltransferase [Clostridiales bacterium]
MGIKLTARLQKIADQVTIGHRVADIGTDHGYIPIYLLKNNISPFVIAGDINERPLRCAENNIEANNLVNSIETRLGSGLSILQPKEVDTVIVAGMGGLLISELIDNSKEIAQNLSTLIFQPMQAQAELREYLVNNDFIIERDILVKEDRHIYEIIVAKPGKQEILDPICYEVGFHINSNPRPLAIEFIAKKIKTAKEIIQNISENASESSFEKLKEMKNKLKRFEEVLLCLQR